MVGDKAGSEGVMACSLFLAGTAEQGEKWEG